MRMPDLGGLADFTRVQTKPIDLVGLRTDGMNVDQHDKAPASDRGCQVTEECVGRQVVRPTRASGYLAEGSARSP